MKRSSSLGILLVLTVALTIVGCNRKTVFSRYQSVDLSGWEQDDSLVFDVPPLETADIYAAEIGLRANSSYPFTSLTMIVEQRAPLSRIEKADTIELAMVNHEGISKGKGIGLLSYSYALPPLTLTKGDSLHVCVRHFMRRNPLPGVSNVGFTLHGGGQHLYAGR